MIEDILPAHREFINKIFNNFGLKEYLDFYDVYCQTKKLPYHNEYHTYCVIELCYKGAKYHDLDYDSTSDLLIAALFHDFGHSGGHSYDSVNIQKAKAWFETCANRLMFDQPRRSQKIVKFIGATEYPYKSEACCIEERILRDADLLQIIMPDGQEMILDRLLQEMKILNTELTREDMIKGQISFLKDVVFQSKLGDYFKHRFEHEIENLMILI